MNPTTATPFQPSQQQHEQPSTSNQQDSQHLDDTHAKKRTRVTPTQLSILEDTFSVSATPDSKMRKHLAQKLQMPERSIQIWFQNRRAKVKMLQRRSLIREEQEMARAKIYAEAAAAAAAAATGSLLTPSSSSSSLSPSSFWYGAPPPPPPPSTLMSGYHLPTSKLPIQRSWSSDPTSPHSFPPPPPPIDQLYQHHLYLPQQPSALSSLYAPSFASVLNDESKDSLFPSHISPSPTPNPSGELGKETAPFNDTLFLDNLTSTSPKNATVGTINANAVTIGTWHRMKINDQDLSCSFQPSTRTFEWYIRDSNYHFKMVISFDLVTSMDITILDHGIFAQVDLVLGEPPLFYMENVDDLTWTQCSDFTEGMQATCHLHHTLRGLASELRQDLLGIISMDPHLCQIIRFPPDLGLPATLDPSSLISWRHQSLPLSMKDFEWSHPPSSTTF